MSDLAKDVESIAHLLCNSGCEGRCLVCPKVVVDRLSARVKKLEEALRTLALAYTRENGWQMEIHAVQPYGFMAFGPPQEDVNAAWQMAYDLVHLPDSARAILNEKDNT